MPYKDQQDKRDHNKRYQLEHSESYKAYQKRYYKENYNKKIERDYYQKYGISLTEYNSLFEEQKGCCYICGKHQLEFKRKLAVDHDHITGQIRSLLCLSCNAHLGIYERYKELFEIYLTERKLLNE